MSDDNMAKCSHNINCNCKECEREYGSLPVLVRGIEVNEKKQTTTNNHYNQPSTSGASTSFSSGASTLFSSGASTSFSSDTHRQVITCQQCHNTFTHRGDYNKHERSHTGEKPYACHVCGVQFADTSNRNRHMRSVHSQERPYRCDSCDQQFSRKDKLEQHQKTKKCMSKK